MEQYIEKIKNIFSKVKTKNVLYVKEGIKPGEDWRRFLVVVSVIFIFGFSFAFYLYTEISSGRFFSGSTDTASSRIVKINQTLLDKTVAEIKHKEALRENIGSNVPSDPSI